MSLSILRQTIFPALGRVELRALSTATPLLKDAVAPKEKKKPGPKPGAKAAAKPKATKAAKEPTGKPVGRPRIHPLPSKGAKKIIVEEDRPPKRAHSAYMLFFKEYYDAHKAELASEGKISIPDLARKIGQKWSDLADEDPQRVEALKAKAKEQGAAYEAAYKEWYFARSAAERGQIEKALNRKLHFPGGKLEFKKELRARPGNPGRPSSSFFEYLRSVTPELQSHPEVVGKGRMEAHQNISRLAAERWRTLPEEEKEQWKKQYYERKVKFDEWFKTQQESGPKK